MTLALIEVPRVFDGVVVLKRRSNVVFIVGLPEWAQFVVKKKRSQRRTAERRRANTYGVRG
jgi:hypothetical protein